MFKLFKTLLVVMLICGQISAQESAQEDVQEIDEEQAEELNTIEEPAEIQSARNYMEFRLGNPSDPQPIIIYTVFTCPHCCKILTNNILQDFLPRHGEKRGVSLRLIIGGKEDIRMLKILRQDCMNMAFDQTMSQESISLKIFWRYVDLAESLMKHRGNLEKAVLDVGFTEEDIENATPDADGEFEKSILYIHTQHSDEVRAINETQELDVPFVVYKGQHIQVEDLDNMDGLD